jgi:serine/alanine adding enzyme
MAYLKHYLQGSAWTAFKNQHGWRVAQFDLTPFEIKDSLNVYTRRVPLIGEIAYIPKTYDLINHRQAPKIIKGLKMAFPKVVVFELEIEEASGEFANLPAGVEPTSRIVQYRSTLKIDLTQEPEAIKSDMSSTTRNEIGKAKKLGVTVKEVPVTIENMEQMYALMQTVHERVGHFVRPKSYLFELWGEFAQAKSCRLFFAEHENKIKSGALLFTEGQRAWYKEGGSIRSESNVPTPSYLQWEIMRALKRDGFVEYDLGGVASSTIDDPNNPMKNVYAFKKRLSSQLHVSPPMLDVVSKRALYALWRRLEPNYLRAYNLLKKDFWY